MSGIEIGKQHFLIEKREEGEFMKIGLLGFEFDSPNKGCEALGYSFVSLIKKNYPDKVEFYVFTNDELGLFPEYFDDICFEKVPLKIKDFSFQMIKAMRKCDFIFDVTLGDSFSDIYSIDQCLSNIRFKFLAEIFGRKYILLPQTYGPFEDKKCRDRSIHILNHADYIFCRDKKSMEFAMRMFFRKSPKYAFSKMFLLAKYKSLRDGFRIFKGTVKRILQGRI